MKKHICSALIGGSLLYLLTIFSVCLTVLDMSDSLFAALLTLAFVLGAMFIVMMFIRHRASLKQQMLFGILWQAVFVTLFLVDSLVGITRSLVSFPEDNFAGGLVIVMFWLSYTGISVIGFLVTTVVQLVKKLRKTK